MSEVNFYDSIEDGLFTFAVIAARHKNKWVLCKHRQRDTYEFPGGHREPGENITDTAKRELWEETGAINYTLRPVCVYSVADNESETFGMLYFAEIYEFEPMPQLEIERIDFFDSLPQSPTQWTYPDIQPHLADRVKHFFNL